MKPRVIRYKRKPRKVFNILPPSEVAELIRGLEESGHEIKPGFFDMIERRCKNV